MRWKQVFIMLVLCLTLGLCSIQTEAGAASKYKIKINKLKNTVTVYEKSGGSYEPYKAFVCSVGHATPVGSFRIYQKHRWRALVQSTYGQYCSRFVGSILFHSVCYHRADPASLFNEEFNKLGTTASHGCIRLTVQDAKWIYDNCPMGTPVIVYKSKKAGPLGKPDTIKLPKGIGYDPTDRWSAGNPYNKKKPKITGAKNKTISYGDTTYDVKKGVRARNTTGFLATKQIKVSIRYRKAAGDPYKKVKKVNTSKPGQYRITYQLEDPIGRKAKVTVTHRVLEKPGQQKGPSENGSDPADQPGKYLPPVPTPPVDTPVSEKMVQS